VFVGGDTNEEEVFFEEKRMDKVSSGGTTEAEGKLKNFALLCASLAQLCIIAFLLKFCQFNNLPCYDIIAPPKTALPFFPHYLSRASIPY
jgi:hypothetical protein